MNPAKALDAWNVRISLAAARRKIEALEARVGPLEGELFRYRAALVRIQGTAESLGIRHVALLAHKALEEC